MDWLIVNRSTVSTDTTAVAATAVGVTACTQDGPTGKKQFCYAPHVCCLHPAGGPNPGATCSHTVAATGDEACTTEFLRMTCKQPASQVQPGATGLSIGTRDFSRDFVTPPPTGTFTPPAGAVCKAGKGPSPPTPFVPGTTCNPKCDTGTLCCRDPSVKVDDSCCFKVTNCSQVHGSSSHAFATAGKPSKDWW